VANLARARSVLLVSALLLLLTGCGGLVGQTDPTPPPTEEPAVAVATEPVVPLADESGDGSRPGPVPAVPGSVGSPPAAGAMSVVELVQRVAPAVVTVVNEQQAGRFGGGQALEAGRGTGFIIDDQGHIVTNHHVVADGDRFEVIFADGESRPAELIGSDPTSDLAVVRVDGAVPATVPFGNSEELLVGQPVVAIGSPLGEFTNTVTDGIISSLGRDLPAGPGQGRATYSNLIQHNAAINPGNSGGPLFDLVGRVIGVNTLGIPQAGQGIPVQGLFFAIPANTVVQIASQLIESGRVTYPYLGIEPQPINPQIASQFDLPIEYGIAVIRVLDGPAAAAGIQPNDFIVAIDGERIDADTSFNELLFEHRPGDTVPVTVLRGDEEFDLEVTLGERPPR